MNLRSQISDLYDELTAAERILAATLLTDYPFAGLDTIQSLADKTQVSAPSIRRFVQKLGYKGYQEFQRGLIGELKEGRQSPLELRRRSRPMEAGYLGNYMDRTANTVSSAADIVTKAQFMRICGILADIRRSICLIGGRNSDPIALFLSRRLQQIRRDVDHVPCDSETWPEYILRMRPRDVLYVVDFRRYDERLTGLAKIASQERGSQVMLVTDKWLSPVAKHANEIMAIPIEGETNQDSYCAAIAINEAIIAHVAAQNRDAVQKRIKDWDELRLK